MLTEHLWASHSGAALPALRSMCCSPSCHHSQMFPSATASPCHALRDNLLINHIQQSPVLFSGAAALSLWVSPWSYQQETGNLKAQPHLSLTHKEVEGPMAVVSPAHGALQDSPRVSGSRSSESQNKAQSTNYLTGNYFLVKTEKWVIKTILNCFH